MEFYPITDLEILLGEKEGVNVTVKKEAIKIDIENMEKGKESQSPQIGSMFLTKKFLLN